MRTTICFLTFAYVFSFTINAANPMLVISIDGLRPDAIKKAKATTLLTLIEHGTSFPNARTVRPSVTLPAHTSMVTGLDPRQHGLTWDDYRPYYGPVRHVTALELVNRAGFHTAMIVAKEKLIHLNRPGSVDYFKQTEKSGDAVRDAFQEYVEKNGLPDLSFLHLPDPDARGHIYLWMSSAYLQGVRAADEALRGILEIANANSFGKPLTVLITADHGGFAFNHMSDIDENNSIPFIAFGENIAAGVEKRNVVRPYDVAPTMLRHFGLAAPAQWDGKAAPIVQDRGPTITPPDDDGTRDGDPPIPELTSFFSPQLHIEPVRF